MPWFSNITRLLLGGLLALHIAWIGVHIYLVQHHELNQWKLGGYGMYTKPAPRFRLYAHVDGFTDADQKAWKRKPAFARLNQYFVLPCQPLTAHSITGFYQDNPQAVGKTTHLLVTIKSFKRYPIEAKYLPKVELVVKWPDTHTFRWQGTVCDQPSEGQGEWLP